MGFLTGDAKRRVELGDGYWADVRALTAGEYAQVEDALVQARLKGSQPDVSSRLSESRRVLVTLSIAEWNLTDENDAPLPLGRASVDRLPMDAFNALHEAAAALSTPRRGQDAAQFRDSDPVGAAGGAAGAA